MKNKLRGIFNNIIFSTLRQKFILHSAYRNLSPPIIYFLMSYLLTLGSFSKRWAAWCESIWQNLKTKKVKSFAQLSGNPRWTQPPNQYSVSFHWFLRLMSTCKLRHVIPLITFGARLACCCSIYIHFTWIIKNLADDRWAAGRTGQ